MKEYTIDIICPLYNAEESIIELNNSLKKQKKVNINDIKYILTESNDKTEEILVNNKIPFKKIEKTAFSHSLVRENAAKESTADIITFITQDVVIEREDWLEQLVKPIIENEAEACYSRQLTKFNNLEKYTREKNYPNKSFIKNKDDIKEMGLKTFFFSDASSAIKREIFKKLNYYDGKNLTTNEDMYIAYKLIMNNYKIKYCADSIVYHSHDFSLKELYDRYKITGQFFKECNFLDKYNTNKSGGELAKYILKRAIEERNIKALIRFFPDMVVRFVGMKVGKTKKTRNKKYKIAYIVSDLKRVGPSNQTLNIIKNSVFKEESIVLTLFKKPEDTMIDEYLKSNITVQCLNLGRNTFILNGKLKLKKTLRDYKVEIVHSYGVKPDCICQKVCKDLKIKHIITLRNYPKEDILTRMGTLKGRIALINHLKTLKKASNVVACSNTIRDKMKSDYPNMNIIAIQNGVDVTKYKGVTQFEKEELRKKYGILNQKVFISTSSFIPRKRIDETIKGFLGAELEDACLLLLGAGNLYESLKKQYEKNKNIKFIGKTDKVNEYLNLSDAFISSSESEGLPNGVIEAIASNIPVILSDIPQHIEIINELKECGKIYPLGNIDSLADKIKNIYLNQYTADIAQSPFTMINMSKKYQDYYRNLMKEII